MQEEFETICKIGTGFSDVQLKEFHAFFAEHALDAPKSNPEASGDTTPCRMTGVTLHCHIRCKEI